MSNFLPPNVIKATKGGDYYIPIKLIFIEAWQQLIKMPKTFWQALGLVVLVLFGAMIFMDFLWWWFDLEIIHFQNHQAQLPNLHTLHGLNSLKALFIRFTGAAIQILRTLLTVSLAFLVLHHIRNQSIKVTMVFAFFKNWRSLLIISVLFYLVNKISNYGLFVLFKAIHLYPQSHLTEPSLAAPFLYFALSALFYSYFLIVAFMLSLLILDKKMPLKGLQLAFKSINQYWIKNIFLLIIVGIAYDSVATAFSILLVSVRGGLGLYFYYLVLLPNLILAVAFVIYKIIAFKNKPSRIKNITLMILRFMLGLLSLELFFLGGLIWLLPVVALLIAIQYQHIFIDNHLAYV